MTSTQLKLAGCLFMAIDHIGAVFFPDVSIYRVVGRLAFPIFAWQLATGYRNTRNMRRFMERLFVFGLLAQAPYHWAFSLSGCKLNVMFSLLMGLACLAAYDKARGGKWGLAAVAVLAAAAEAVPVDHGAYGILCIFLFHRYYGLASALIKAQAGLVAARQAAVAAGTLAGIFRPDEWYVWAQPAALLSVPLVSAAQATGAGRWKYFFYWFYPAHLLLLASIRHL